MVWHEYKWWCDIIAEYEWYMWHDLSVCLHMPHTYKHTHILICVYKNMDIYTYNYGVATVSRINKIIGLFCRISSVL